VSYYDGQTTLATNSNISVPWLPTDRVYVCSRFIDFYLREDVTAPIKIRQISCSPSPNLIKLSHEHPPSTCRILDLDDVYESNS